MSWPCTFFISCVKTSAKYLILLHGEIRLLGIFATEKKQTPECQDERIDRLETQASTSKFRGEYANCSHLSEGYITCFTQYSSIFFLAWTVFLAIAALSPPCVKTL